MLTSHRHGSGAAKAQAAMEYLMTYWWAILILVIVIAALFYLGVLGGLQTSETLAQPGACYVQRPEGAGTTEFISLGGFCNSAAPKYVATLSYSVGGHEQAFRSNATVQTVNNTFTDNLGGNEITISAWIWVSGWKTSGNTRQDVFVYSGGPCPTGSAQGARLSVDNVSEHELDFMVEFDPARIGDCKELYTPANSLQLDRWYFVVGVYNGTYMSDWINGTSYATYAVTNNIDYPNTYNTAANAIWIGGSTGSSGSSSAEAGFNGYISNIQVYDTGLSPSDIKELYDSGIGGDPVVLQSLVAWWPLNGNANDYSGNGNNAQPVNGAGFSSTWITTSPPPPPP